MNKKQRLQEMCDKADVLLDEDGILAVDSLARAWYNNQGGTTGSMRLRDVLDYVESHRDYIGRYLRLVRRLVVPVTQYAVAAGFSEVAAMTSDADLNRCIPGNGDGQSTAGWMAVTVENHPVLVAYLLRKINVKNGQELAIAEQLEPAARQGIIPPSQVGRILAGSRSRLPSKRNLIASADGEVA